jgi:hypothetical protein
MHIRENLTLIASTNDTITAEHNDLIFHLFHLLEQSPIPLFKEAIEKWHFMYVEANMPQLTPIKV